LKEAEENGPYDLIIVSRHPLEKDQWSRTMKARVYWSKYLFDKGLAKKYHVFRWRCLYPLMLKRK
jgi:hypothetical protein